MATIGMASVSVRAAMDLGALSVLQGMLSPEEHELIAGRLTERAAALSEPERVKWLAFGRTLSNAPRREQFRYRNGLVRTFVGEVSR